MTSRGGCWEHLKTYGWPEDGPQLMHGSVDEIEFSLRMQFPGVFRAAEERRRWEIYSKQKVFVRNLDNMD